MDPEVPEWLQPEYVRAALAGESCARCGAPRWLCRGVSGFFRGLVLLTEMPYTGAFGDAAGGLKALDLRWSGWWCWAEAVGPWRIRPFEVRCW